MAPSPGPWSTTTLPECTVWWRSHEGALESVVAGRLTAEGSRLLAKCCDDVIERSTTPIAFHDWSQVASYEIAARSTWQRWLGQQTRIEAVHFLAGSTLLSMGLAVANLAYPRIRFDVHRPPESYRRARDLVMPPAPRPTRG